MGASIQVKVVQRQESPRLEQRGQVQLCICSWTSNGEGREGPKKIRANYERRDKIIIIIEGVTEFKLPNEKN